MNFIYFQFVFPVYVKQFPFSKRWAQNKQTELFDFATEMKKLNTSDM